jgi:hypothetical protein
VVILVHEGMSLIFINTVKVAPSIATSFFTYELVKEFLITA